MKKYREILIYITLCVICSAEFLKEEQSIKGFLINLFGFIILAKIVRVANQSLN